jgi:hypothetical protein
VAMEVETTFLRLFKAVSIGDRIDGWRVCWVGGWDKCRVLFVVMIERVRPRKRWSQRVQRRLSSPAPGIYSSQPAL